MNMPHWVFGASVLFMLLTVVLAFFTERRRMRRVMLGR